jgi:hypothetical protein
MNHRFSISKLAATMKAEAKPAMVAARYYRVVHKSSGYQFVCGYSRELTQHVGALPEIMKHDTHHEITDDSDAALKLLDGDVQRANSLLVEIAKHVSIGHYNDSIIEQLRRICETEKWHKVEAILASAPPRQSQGPIEEWIMHAIGLYRDMRLAVLIHKRELHQKILGR